MNSTLTIDSTTDRLITETNARLAAAASPVPLRQPISPDADPVPAAVDVDTGEPIELATLKEKPGPRWTMTVAGNYKTGELVLVFSEPVAHAAIPLGQVRDLVETIRREANNLRRYELANPDDSTSGLRPREPKRGRKGGRR